MIERVEKIECKFIGGTKDGDTEMLMPSKNGKFVLVHGLHLTDCSYTEDGCVMNGNVEEAEIYRQHKVHEDIYILEEQIGF